MEEDGFGAGVGLSLRGRGERVGSIPALGTTCGASALKSVEYPLCESVDYRADIFFWGGVADDFFPVADDFSFNRRWRWGSVDKGNF